MKKETLQTGCLDQHEDLLVDVHVQVIKEVTREILNRAVEAAIRGKEPSKVMRITLSDINKKEKHVGRGERMVRDPGGGPSP